VIQETITLPFVIAGFLALAGSWRAAAGMALIPCALIAGRWTDIIHLYAKVQQNQALVAAGASPALKPLPYFLTELKASVFYYLRMFIFPLNQSVDPYVAPIERLTEPAFLASAFVLIFLATFCFWMRKKAPFLSFAVIALLASPLTAYALMPLADTVAEHRVYIAGLGIDLIVAWVLTLRPRHCLAAISTVTLALGLFTLHRLPVWADGIALWRDAAIQAPKLARPHINLGLAYQTVGRLDEALAEYRQAVQLNPKLSLPYINMSGIYLLRNDLDSAEFALNKAAQLSPTLAEPYLDLAVVELRRNRPAKALELADKAAMLSDSYLVHLNRGEVLSRLGRQDEAAREYARAVESRPDLPDLRQQIDRRLHPHGIGTNTLPPAGSVMQSK